MERESEQEPSCPFWHLINKQGAPLLYKTDETHYQVTVPGTFGHMLIHKLYIIIHKRLLDFFKAHSSTIHSALPVSIYDKPNNSYIPDYFYIKAPPISSGTLPALSPDECGLWIDTSIGLIFISRKLKEIMKAEWTKEFCFIAGYSFIA